MTGAVIASVNIKVMMVVVLVTKFLWLVGFSLLELLALKFISRREVASQ